MVSIVIPVYNVEKYLKDCVNSVISQTYRDLQIILVDDGSTDSSGDICDAFAEKDERIQVIHKKNGGLSDARNVGTAVSDGAFVFYLDSDDYLEQDAINTLLTVQKDSGAEVVIGNYYYTYCSREDIAQPDNSVIKVYSRKEAINLLMQGKIQTFAWGKLIQADIAKKYMFPVGRLFEDHFWTHLVFNECSTIIYMSAPIVHYRQRENSISYTVNVSRLDILIGWQERIIFLQNEYPELVEMYLERCAKDSLNLAWLVLTRMKKKKRQGFLKIQLFVKENKLCEKCCGNTYKLIKSLEASAFLYACMAIGLKVLGRKIQC